MKRCAIPPPTPTRTKRSPRSKLRYAEAKTAKFFETQNRLATEHALIEDTGKGEGVKDPSAENGEGLIADRFALLHLGTSAAHGQRSGEAEAAEAKEDLEAQIDELKYRKASMDPAEYRRQLQTPAVDLAQDPGGARQMSTNYYNRIALMPRIANRRSVIIGAVGLTARVGDRCLL